ncbi:MAG: two-component system invasion response regulator UvrY [Saprospiraceae bacterium]|jgi:DNA-binding NarL/FixJ family response regulator
MAKDILLIDDHNIVINGLRLLLKTELLDITVSESICISCAHNTLNSSAFDLAIVDLNMNNSNCFDLIKHIKLSSTKTKILVYTSYPEEVFALRLYKMGIQGFVNKQESIRELSSAIHTVLSGKIYYSERTKELLLESLGKTEDLQTFDRLSDRELEVALLLSRGKTLMEIEVALAVSKSTASTFKRRVFSKLNISNILELSELCMIHNIG